MKNAQYVIRATYSFYGPREERDLVRDGSDDVAIFDSRKAAEERIGQIDRQTYILRHNESSAPEYKALSVNALPNYLREQL